MGHDNQAIKRLIIMPIQDAERLEHLLDLFWRRGLFFNRSEVVRVALQLLEQTPMKNWEEVAVRLERLRPGPKRRQR
jgi:Arc/MetJ-type ribon-helix-helix transcriptional regulator